MHKVVRALPAPGAGPHRLLQRVGGEIRTQRLFAIKASVYDGRAGSRREHFMGLMDRLKDLTKKAEGVVVEHKEQIQQTVVKAGAAVDARTDGKYHEQIQKAEAKTGAAIDKLDPKNASSAETSKP